jgi:hypothetical protein
MKIGTSYNTWWTTGVDARMSDSGWLNTVLKEHFVKYIPNRESGQHVLLLLDGHKSHMELTYDIHHYTFSEMDRNKQHQAVVIHEMYVQVIQI